MSTAHPTAVKKKALKLWRDGHKTASISRAVGVSVATITRWAREAKAVRRGSVEELVDDTDFVLPIEKDESIPLVRIQESEKRDAVLATAVQTAATPADQYNAFVAAKGTEILQQALNSGVLVPKTYSDIQKLDAMIRDSLGLNNKKGGGIGGRISIDLKVLQAQPAKGTIEAEVVDPEED
jgi:hypothetical protein